MATIDIAQLNVQYKNTSAGVHDIDLTVQDGEFVALVGPSGSGKTTLLRAIAGFIKPQAGSVKIGDRTIVAPGIWVPPESRKLGMVFQQHAIWPHWTVGGNIRYPLKLSGMNGKDIRERVTAALAQVGLEGAENRKPSTLSGGQQQRVAIARALVMRPAALLLDEALASLDEPLRARLRMELKRLTAEFGLTVIHVTHDRSEALSLADRIVALKDGRIQQVGSPEELVNSPANEFMAEFLNDATLLAGELRMTEQGTSLWMPNLGSELRMDSAHIQGEGRGTTGTLAILPQDVEVERSTESGGTIGVVRSVLFGRSGYEVVLDFHGEELRVLIQGWRPEPGERLRVAVRRGLFFPGNGDQHTEKQAA